MFCKSSLKLIFSNRKQRAKINDRYSSWSEILFEVPQELRSWGLCIANYADDSTPYYGGKSAEFVANNLKQLPTILFECLNNNYMKVNTGKSHLLLSGNSRATAVLNRKISKYY